MVLRQSIVYLRSSLMSSTTIKSIITNRFEVELFQYDDGAYCIRYRTNKDDMYSERITDFGMASFMFDLKVHDLEGN